MQVILKRVERPYIGNSSQLRGVQRPRSNQVKFRASFTENTVSKNSEKSARIHRETVAGLSMCHRREERGSHLSVELLQEVSIAFKKLKSAFV